VTVVPLDAARARRQAVQHLRAQAWDRRVELRNMLERIYRLLADRGGIDRASFAAMLHDFANEISDSAQ
jgi:hypothetical protein